MVVLTSSFAMASVALLASGAICEGLGTIFSGMGKEFMKLTVSPRRRK